MLELAFMHSLITLFFIKAKEKTPDWSNLVLLLIMLAFHCHFAHIFSLLVTAANFVAENVVVFSYFSIMNQNWV